MDSGSSGHSEMRTTNLKFLAQCRGNRFEVSVRALKGSYALLVCPFALVKGDRLVLTPTLAGATPGFGRLQLFARVLVPHPSRCLYEAVWEKLVSPPGLTVMMEYLQSNLGVCIAANHLLGLDWVDNELAYFDFASATVNFPSRGQAPAHRVDSVHYGSLPDELKPLGAPHPLPFSAPGSRTLVTPTNPVRSGTWQPQATAASTHQKRQETKGADVYGMNVSQQDMDLIDQLSGATTRPTASPADAAAHQGAGNEQAQKRRGPVTMIIKSIASSLSGGDPFDDTGKR